MHVLAGQLLSICRRGVPDERWLRSPSHNVAHPQRLHSMDAWRRIERGGGAKSTRMRELSRWAMSEGSTQKAEGDTG